MYGKMLPALALAGVLGLFLAPDAWAQTASNLVCDKCVGKGDLAKKAVTRSRIKRNAVTGAKIKDGAVDFDKLSSSVQQRISPSFRLEDADNNPIGTVVSLSLFGTNPRVMTMVEIAGRIILIEVNENQIPQVGSLLFETPDCTGTPHVDVRSFGGFLPAFDRVVITGVVGDLEARALHEPDGSAAISLNVGSGWGNNGCFADGFGPTEVFSLLELDPDLHATFPRPYMLIRE